MALRKELGVIFYEKNVLGYKGPRKMLVGVPQVNVDGTVNATAEEDLMEARPRVC